MGRLADQVHADRALRNEARRNLDRRLDLIRQDLETRGIGGRIADRVSEEARETFEQALEIAGESKGVITGTIALLTIWLLRNPILTLLEHWLADARDNQGN